MGVTTSRPSCSCCCCFFNCVGRCLLRLILGVVYYFQWDVPSVERDQIHQEGTPQVTGLLCMKHPRKALS